MAEKHFTLVQKGHMDFEVLNFVGGFTANVRGTREVAEKVRDLMEKEALMFLAAAREKGVRIA